MLSKMWFDLIKWVNRLSMFTDVLSKGVYQMNKFTNKIWDQVLDNLFMCVLFFLNYFRISVILAIRSAKEMNPYVVQLETSEIMMIKTYAHRFKRWMKFFIPSYWLLLSFCQKINMKLKNSCLEAFTVT